MNRLMPNQAPTPATASVPLVDSLQIIYNEIRISVPPSPLRHIIIPRSIRRLRLIL